MMKCAASSLSLGLFVVFHSVEIISSRPGRADSPLPTHLIRLYPESNNYHLPDIEQLKPAQVEGIPGFGELYGNPRTKEPRFYLKRGPIIFGYTMGPGDNVDEEIENLGNLYREPYFRAIFDTTRGEWFTLEFREYQRMGVGRNLPIVLAHDEAHAKLHKKNYLTNKAAHDAASEHAYRETWLTEPYIRMSEETEIQRIQRVKQVYRHHYESAYQPHAAKTSGGQSKEQ